MVVRLSTKPELQVRRRQEGQALTLLDIMAIKAFIITTGTSSMKETNKIKVMNHVTVP